ncbi:MAG: hypothetical protein QXS37_02335 [Candidatus Aenigmatarchaeota archaeon]
MRDKSLVILSFLLFSSLFLVYSFVPIYEKEDDSFRNILTGGNKYWHEGISPLTFAYFNHYLKNRNFGLMENTTIDEKYKTNVTQYVDVICIKGLCYPTFYNYGLHAFFEFSFWFNKIFQLNPLSYLLITNIIIYAFSVVVLFAILNRINKDKILMNFALSLLVGLGTSFIIYSKYLFLHNSFQTFTFAIFLFSFLLFEERKTKLRFLFLLLSSISFIIFYQALPAMLIAVFLILWFLIFNYKKVKKFILFNFVAIFVLITFLELNVFLNYLNLLSKNEKTLVQETNLFYNLYDQTFFAIDIKPVSFSYSITNNLGNAIFLKIYPIFGYFFGPKGIFVNSPFLLFSFFGIAFSKNKIKLKLLLLLAFLVLFVAYVNPDYEGGFSPRYVRHAKPVIILLTIFLADYLGKEKKKLILSIFIFLALISVTNSISIAIRSDWNYIKITDLVSYDAVIWPWLPIKQEDIVLDLKKVSEQAKWILNWEDGCNPPSTEPRFSSFGLELGPCQCTFKNTASRKIEIPKHINYIGIRACSRFSGGDGIILRISIDDKNYSYYLESSKCEDIYINVNEFADSKLHTVSFSSERNGVCDYEVLVVEKLNLLKEVNITQELNLVKKPWVWEVYSPCSLYWLNGSIVTNKCYCTQSSYAFSTIKFEKEFPFLNLEVCADEGGNDGVLGKIILNDKTYDFFIPSNFCVNRSIFVDIMEDKINLTLTSEIYGYCNKERLLWKRVMFEREPSETIEKDKNTYDLASKEEQLKWELNFPKICKPPITEPRFSEVGIETGPCACNFINNASRKITLPEDLNALRIEVCSKSAGGDGISTYVYLDDKEVVKSKIEATTCKNIIVDISKFADNKEHVLTLESKRYKNCFDEVAIWKKIELVKWDEQFPLYEFDVSNEVEKWGSSSEVCPADFTYEGIITDVCGCLYPAQANYYIKLEEEKNVKLKIKACAYFAGGDGVIGEVSIDNNLVKQIFIKTNGCTSIEESINLKKGVHTLKLQPKIYGVCNAEIIKWKEVTIA